MQTLRIKLYNPSKANQICGYDLLKRFTNQEGKSNFILLIIDQFTSYVNTTIINHISTNNMNNYLDKVIKKWFTRNNLH